MPVEKKFKLKKGDKEHFTCAICNDEVFDKKHDIRPIKSKRGDFCCTSCNCVIVSPTRLSIWGNKE